MVNANHEQGGLKIISVQDMQNSVFKTNGWKIFFLNKDAKWATFAFSEFNQPRGDLSIFHSNLELKQMQGLSCLKNNFWRSVLCAWATYLMNQGISAPSMK